MRDHEIVDESTVLSKPIYIGFPSNESRSFPRARGNHHESLLFVVTCCNQQPSHLPFGHCIPVALRLSGVETAVKH